MSTQQHTGTKLNRMLKVFAHGGRLNRFEAERVGDHTLPQTVDALERRHGLNFVRTVEIVPGFGSSRVRTIRYALDFQEQQRARALLSQP